MSARNRARLAAKALERTHAKHPCGACAVCCTVKGVGEIAKPEGMRCARLTGSGELTGSCGTHGARPQSCRDFFCAYRHGLLGAGVALRPDKLGLLFEVAGEPPPGILLLAVRETRPEAIEECPELLDRLAATGLVLYLIRGDRRFFMGPEERVKTCQAWGRRHLPVVAR